MIPEPATPDQLQPVRDALEEFRAYWKSLRAMPGEGRFDGSLDDLFSLDYMDYEVGFSASDEAGSALVWGNVVATQTLYRWHLHEETGNLLLAAEGMPTIWPHGRVYEGFRGHRIDFRWLFEEVVLLCLGYGLGEPEDRPRLASLLSEPTQRSPRDSPADLLYHTLDSLERARSRGASSRVSKSRARRRPSRPYAAGRPGDAGGDEASSPALEFGGEEAACARPLIELGLAEDLGEAGDLTAITTIPADAVGSARFVARTPGVLAGLPILGLLADRLGPGLELRPLRADGDRLGPGLAVAEIRGPMRAILAMERTALNFLQRLSGIATLTARYVDLVRGGKATILDTRKTTPGWRALEKYAVRAGGGVNHRVGLYDMILIKDNHLAYLDAGGDPLGTAIAAARAGAPAGMLVEVEVDSIEQLRRALECGPDIILLDNMGPDRLAIAVRVRDQYAPTILLEASGGVNLETVVRIAATGVDRISVGALTHSAPSLDIGLDYGPAGP